MTSPYRELTVRLQRDALNTPWGFRLQGGTDFQAPLTVQRVFAGSPSQTDLQRGDTILQIENVDVNNMPHRKAQDIIRTAGSTLTLTIKRGPKLTQHTNTRTTPALPVESITAPAHFRSRSWDSSLLNPPSAPEGALVFIPKPPPQPAMTMRGPQEYGVDYRSRPAQRNLVPNNFNFNKPSAPKPSNMLNRLNKSLTNRLWTTPEGATYYDDQPVANGIPIPPRSHSSHAIRNPQPVVYEEADYNRRTVAELKGKFSKPWKQNQPVYPKERASSSAAPAPKLGQPADHSVLPSWLTDQNPVPVPSKKSNNLPKQYVSPGTTGTRLPDYHSHSLPGPGYHSQSLPAPSPKSPRYRDVPVNARLSHVMNNSVPYVDYGEPAWKGTLRGSGPSHGWEQRSVPQAAPSAPTGPAQVVTPHKPQLQKMTYGGDGTQTYSQHNPAKADAPEAKGAHLQYNSPLQLYSRGNAEQTMQAQLQGTPAEGTVQMSGGGQYGPGGAYTAPNQKPERDFAKSSLAQLVQQEDSRKSARNSPAPPAPKGPSGGALYGHAAGTAQVSARYVDHAPGQEMVYTGYQDQQHQSPSMRALQHHVEDVATGGGFSDF